MNLGEGIENLFLKVNGKIQKKTLLENHQKYQTMQVVHCDVIFYRRSASAIHGWIALSSSAINATFF